jgi:hypothetical protein
MPSPRIVLVSGAPGSGKTTLGRRLADALSVPHVNKDRIREGLWLTDPSIARDGDRIWGIWMSSVRLLLAAGVFVVVDQTLYRGKSEAERGGGPTNPLFPTRRGRALSRDAVEHRLAKYANSAANRCPSLRTKRVSAHVLRLTAAMQLLQADVDTSVIALWLGHEHVETTQIYLHADLGLKRTGTCPNPATSHRAGPVPALRLPPGFPGELVIMPIFSAPTEFASSQWSA